MGSKRLTDISSSSGLTLSNLIHIVNTGDTSQGNPAGSSYKATLGQVADAFSSIFSKGFTGGTVSGPTNFNSGLSANTVNTSSITLNGVTYTSFSSNGLFTGGTVAGQTTFSGGLSANTINTTSINTNGLSANTINTTSITINGVTVTGFTNFVTGGSYSPSNGTLTLTTQGGTPISITGLTSGGGTFTGGTVSGPTTFNNGLTANTVNTTSFTLNGVTYTSFPSGGSFTGGTVAGQTTFSGGLSANTINVNGLTANTVNATSFTLNGVTITGFTFGTTFTGNTSASCITDLYVTNLNSCSPLYIQNKSNGNVLIGRSGTTKVGIGTSSPEETLHIKGNIKFEGQSNNPIYNAGGGVYSAITQLNYITLNFNNSSIQTVTLTGNTYFNTPLNYKNGGIYTLIVKQGNGGPYTISWFTNIFKWENGSTPTPSSGTDLITFISDGDVLYGIIAKNFS